MTSDELNIALTGSKNVSGELIDGTLRIRYQEPAGENEMGVRKTLVVQDVSESQVAIEE